MEVPIKRIDKGLALPEYKTPGAAGMDCLVREDTTIEPGAVGMVSLNVAIKPPAGHFILLAARGSLHKRGLMMANSVGIGDEDYCGDNDEYKAPLLNFSKETVSIKRGERVAQMLVLPIDRVQWKEVESLGDQDRGGFGTTGI
jgi:dUTP pyrophosphatase